MASTPPLAEIEQNHITHAVLEATNFFWDQHNPDRVERGRLLHPDVESGRGVMDAYQAETGLNMMFEPIMPGQADRDPRCGRGHRGRGDRKSRSDGACGGTA